MILTSLSLQNQKHDPDSLATTKTKKEKKSKTITLTQMFDLSFDGFDDNKTKQSFPKRLLQNQ